ncbi:DNA mismatch repair protein MutS [Hymenobacter gummosus]|uniref:DNA mismatch repair protein MutS n=1 Tax=Hymenobacter gummosus TaxID=1776032 RepID=A0A3S0H8Y0_9BACT|nr:DNA mismatch repair protein MutS [Hymenobacter gummosus]RTQ49292.1 DNA mismatch repair protein MutS [Hymenobacter gummosus]
MPVANSIRPLAVSPAEVFTDNLTTYAAEERHFAGRHSAIAWLRLAVVLLVAGGSWWLFRHSLNLAGVGCLLGGYAVFMLIMRWHGRVGYELRQRQLLRRINQEELDRLAGKLAGFDAGQRYADPQHPYTADLDVFGPHSLFQLLSRTTSRLGQDQLAGWLQAPAAPAEVQARQQAVAELAPDVAWRQNWQARARHFPKQSDDPRPFLAWMHEPDFYQGRGWLLALLAVLPPLGIVGTVLWLDGESGWLPAVPLLLMYGLNHRFRQQRDTVFERCMDMYDVLRAYRDQLRHLEARACTAPRLAALRAVLLAHGAPASAYVGRLARIAQNFSLRWSTLAGFFANNLLMWDFFWMWRLERWKGQLGGRLEPWLEAVAETEALTSLAATQYANPGWAVPALVEEPLTYEAAELAHPLIFSPGRVANDFATTGPGRTGLVTGSNMSGKTTFLRTVGINGVLALAGGPVCAARLRIGPMLLFTAMRTQDNLAESTSSFYAELKRLRQLLDLTEAGQPVFFLLDEILKGTNSRDRHDGARGLIRQLHRRPASGLVSTHDLELGDLARELPGFVTNYSFNSDIVGDEIRFDYRLTPGLCREFNASKLMELMGIELEKN